MDYTANKEVQRQSSLSSLRRNGPIATKSFDISALFTVRPFLADAPDGDLLRPELAFLSQR